MRRWKDLEIRKNGGGGIRVKGLSWGDYNERRRKEKSKRIRKRSRRSRRIMYI